MTEPLENFKHLIVHPAPGAGLELRRLVPVHSTASAAVYLAELLCQGYHAAQFGVAIHAYHPKALGTVPLQLLSLTALLGLEPGSEPGGTQAPPGVDRVARSHGPNPSQAVPTPAVDWSNVVPIDIARIRAGTVGGRL